MRFNYLKIEKFRFRIFAGILAIIVAFLIMNASSLAKPKDINNISELNLLSNSEISRSVQIGQDKVISNQIQPLCEKNANSPKKVSVFLQNLSKSQNSSKFEANVYSEEEVSNNVIFPYISAVNTAEKTYDFNNMVAAAPAPELKDLQTAENLNSLAKIIHCEMCASSNYEAALSVGTVVINRVCSHKFSNTIEGVISQPKQFSPYTNGNYFTCVPCEECLRAAYEILYNNYRSFPSYVYYFQSISKNYFSETLPYVTFSGSSYSMYFSYNPKDLPAV